MNRKLIYDVAVVGGGTSGVAAAIGASDAGKKVLLIERNPYLGGQATNCNVPAFCGFCTSGEKAYQVIKGVGQEALDRMAKIGYFVDFYVTPSTGNRTVPHDPEITKMIFEEMLLEHNIDFILHCSLTDVKSNDGIIESLICQDDEGQIEVIAKSYVDASGEANLAYLAKAPVEFHHEQKGSLMFRIGGIKDEDILTSTNMEDAINRAIGDGVVGLTAKKGFPVRVPHTNDYLVNIIGLDFENLDARTLTKSEIEGRKQARTYFEVFKKYIKGMEDTYLVSTGPKVGLRESRRIIGEYTLSKDDVKTSRKSSDTIARGGWGAEIHKGSGEASYIFERNDKYFDIPLGTLKPKNTKNLWCAGRIISSDLTASASIRVMGTGFGTGQGAGIAAALAIDDKTDIKDVQKELKRQGALI